MALVANQDRPTVTSECLSGILGPLFLYFLPRQKINTQHELINSSSQIIISTRLLRQRADNRRCLISSSSRQLRRIEEFIKSNYLKYRATSTGYPIPQVIIRSWESNYKGHDKYPLVLWFQNMKDKAAKPLRLVIVQNYSSGSSYLSGVQLLTGLYAVESF